MGQTQETTGATRFRGPTVITLRGAGSLGHDPLTVGAGDDIALRLQVPTNQSANILTVEQPDGTVIFAINAAGAIVNGGLAGPQTGLGSVGVAHAIYNFAVDGGASCTPAANATIPANALLIGATINPTTAVAAAGSATLEIGTTAGSSATSILGSTGKASLTADALINGACTFASPVKMSAAGQILITVETGPLTQGVIEVLVVYVVPANS
jgi:hypothetical protein